MPASPISTTSRWDGVVSVPLYEERYHLITGAGNAFSDRERVSWAEVGELPLCLLTPDMQNRRLIDQHLAEAGAVARPTLESNSMIVLFSHIRTGKWSSIMPLNLAETFGFGEPIRAIPIVEPDARHIVGLVAAQREPHTPLVAALLAEARRAIRARRLGRLYTEPSLDRNFLSNNEFALFDFFGVLASLLHPVDRIRVYREGAATCRRKGTQIEARAKARDFRAYRARRSAAADSSRHAGRVRLRAPGNPAGDRRGAEPLAGRSPRRCLLLS